MYDKYKGFENIKKIVNTAHKVYTKLENPSIQICVFIFLISFPGTVLVIMK